MKTCVAILLFVLCSGIAATAQAAKVPERDYFTAPGEDPLARNDLDLNDSYHTNFILDWIKKGRVDRALEDAKFVLNKWPNHPRCLILMEVIARVAHAPSLPIPYYEKAVKYYPQYAITHAQYGRYLVEIGQVSQGMAQLQQAIDIDPTMAAAHAWLSEAHHKQGNKDLARKAAAQARELGYQGELPEEPSAQTAK